MNYSEHNGLNIPNHYADPTAKRAISKADTRDKKLSYLVKLIKCFAELNDYKINFISIRKIDGQMLPIPFALISMNPELTKLANVFPHMAYASNYYIKYIIITDPYHNTYKLNYIDGTIFPLKKEDN